MLLSNNVNQIRKRVWQFVLNKSKATVSFVNVNLKGTIYSYIYQQCYFFSLKPLFFLLFFFYIHISLYITSRSILFRRDTVSFLTCFHTSTLPLSRMNAIVYLLCICPSMSVYLFSVSASRCFPSLLYFSLSSKVIIYIVITVWQLHLLTQRQGVGNYAKHRLSR